MCFLQQQFLFRMSLGLLKGVRGSATSDGIFIESSPSPWQPEQATCSLEGRANCVAKAGGEASKGAPINVALGLARTQTLHNLHTAWVAFCATLCNTASGYDPRSSKISVADA